MIIAMAIPFFLLLMALEYAWSRRLGKRVYRFDDTFADLACGMGNRALGLLWVGATFGVYTLLFQRFALFELPPILAWPLALIGQDFTYYWYHRASHRINFLWATHVVHHQSEEYNLAVALRQSWFTSLTGFVFDLPLAFLGVPPIVYASVVAINLLYQFWIHTRLIDRMGAFELVFNTPSHHRVHHGTQTQYLDSNYAGMFIVWDKLFGTFVPEQEEPRYGTVRPFRSLDPLWANVEPWLHLAWMARQARSWRERLIIWFQAPDWKPQGVDPMAVPPLLADRSLRAQHGSDPKVYAYISLWGLPAVGVVLLLLVLEERRTLALTGLLAGALVCTLVAFAALLERWPWARTLERTRLAGVMLLGLVLGILWPEGQALPLALLGLGLFSAAWLEHLPIGHKA